MTLKEYFAQDKYFSESTREFLSLSDMPFQHVYYAVQNLHSEHGDAFMDTELWRTFMRRLYPSSRELQRQLETFGKATVVDVYASRQRLYYAAKQVGVQVKTHKERKWITAEVVS